MVTRCAGPIHPHSFMRRKPLTLRHTIFSSIPQNKDKTRHKEPQRISAQRSRMRFGPTGIFYGKKTERVTVAAIAPREKKMTAQLVSFNVTSYSQASTFNFAATR